MIFIIRKILKTINSINKENQLIINLKPKIKKKHEVRNRNDIKKESNGKKFKFLK